MAKTGLGCLLAALGVAAGVGLGVALTQLGRPEEAILKYQLALELDPRDAAAHNNLGWTLASQGRIADAVPHFERALDLDPAYDNARRNLDRARQLLSDSTLRRLIPDFIDSIARSEAHDMKKCIRAVVITKIERRRSK